MNKKNKIKAIVALAVALAFVMPGAVAFANDVSPVSGMKRELVTETYAIERTGGIKTISS